METYLITDDDFQSTVRDWIREDGDIWAEALLARTGGLSAGWLITSVDQFDQIAARLTSYKDSVGGLYVFRRPRFLLRGIVDDDLVAKALATFSDTDEWMSACQVSDDPLDSWGGSGDIGHELLLERLEDCRGKYLLIDFDADWPDMLGRTSRYDDQTVIVGRLLGSLTQ